MDSRRASLAEFQAALDRRGSSVRLVTKYDPLLQALPKGLSSVQTVFAEGYSLNGMGEAANALHICYDKEDWDILTYLCRVQHLDVNRVDKMGKTVLHKACAAGDVKTMSLLFTLGADVNLATEEDGYTPIHIAAETGSYDLVLGLIDRGADPSAPTTVPTAEGTNPTPCELAEAKGHSSVVGLLASETDPELLELKSRKDKLMSKLAPDAKKIVNNELTGPMVIHECKLKLPDTIPPPSLSVLTNLQRLPVSEAMLLEEFDKIDVDNNGWIMKGEFKKLYETFENFGAPELKVDKMIEKFNMMGDDKLSFEEYCLLRLKVAQR